MISYKKIIVFGIIILSTLISQVYVQQRYTHILQGGAEYQWPVMLCKSVEWVPTDYLDVHFLGNIAKWKSNTTPKIGDTVYVTLDVKQNGLVAVKEASYEKPNTDVYIRARITRINQEIVEFEIPFHRVQLDLSKVNPQFYHSYKGVLLATIKISDGYGVVTGIYDKGVAIENANPDSLAEQSKKLAIPTDAVLEYLENNKTFTNVTDNENGPVREE